MSQLIIQVEEPVAEKVEEVEKVEELKPVEEPVKEEAPKAEENSPRRIR